MKSKLLAGVAMSLGLALGAHGQALTEYSHASSASAGASMSAPSSSFNSASNQTASRVYGGGGPSSHASAGGESGKSFVWEDKSLPSKRSPNAKPNPPAIFVLSNGERVESSNYFLTVDSVRIEQNGSQRTIPMSSVNMDATVAANHQRGLNLKVPTNKSQIMVSF